MPLPNLYRKIPSRLKVTEFTYFYLIFYFQKADRKEKRELLFTGSLPQMVGPGPKSGTGIQSRLPMWEIEAQFT